MPPDHAERLAVLEQRVLHRENDSTVLWDQIEGLRKLLNDIREQNTQILTWAKGAPCAAHAAKIEGVEARLNVNVGEKKTLAGLITFFAMPLGGFMFWVVEQIMTVQKHP